MCDGVVDCFGGYDESECGQTNNSAVGMGFDVLSSACGNLKNQSMDDVSNHAVSILLYKKDLRS